MNTTTLNGFCISTLLILSGCGANGPDVVATGERQAPAQSTTAQTEPGVASDQAPDLTVAGFVHAADGSPLSGVNVCLQSGVLLAWDIGGCATSEADGSWTLDGLPRDFDVTIGFEKAGFVPTLRAIHMGQADIVLPDDENRLIAANDAKDLVGDRAGAIQFFVQPGAGEAVHATVTLSPSGAAQNYDNPNAGETVTGVFGNVTMGVVWAAIHLLTRKRVALKFLKGPIHLRPELRRRFLREARAASAIQHPNVLEVHDVFDLDDGTPVMLMDLLEGETLGQRIAREGALSLPDTADILVQVLSGVGTAHAVGVVHRDLKPDNIFLVRTTGGAPSVRVLDFGIAKLCGSEGPAVETGVITGTGAMLGTPCYMSPEQAFGEKDIDHRSDVWSLGAILYECLTGARPVEGDSVGQVVKRLLSGGITPLEVMRPDLPKEIVDLVGQMLSRERDRRPGDLRGVSAVLSRHATVRAPEFGPVGSAPPEEAPAPRLVIDSDSSDPVASTHHARRAPETAGAHTVSSPGITRGKSRATWALVPLLVIGASLAAVSALRSPGGPGSSASAGSVPSTTVLPVATPVTQTATPVSSPAAPPPPVPAMTEPPASTRPPVDRAPKPSAQKRGASAPVVSATPAAPSAAPRPAPAPESAPHVGGLAEKPPF